MGWRLLSRFAHFLFFSSYFLFYLTGSGKDNQHLNLEHEKKMIFFRKVVFTGSGKFQNCLKSKSVNFNFIC
jgi:hypothetical protein